MVERDDSHMRKRLLFQSRHRGVKELDLVLGPFADTHLADMTIDELRLFADFLDEPDPAIFAWLTAQADLPPRHDNSVARLILEFALKRACP